MTSEEYRSFWERLLGRYPEFNPTKQQTEDWHRELNHYEPSLLEAAVATIITKFTSNVPKLPWLINTYNNIKNERTRSNTGVTTKETDEELESIKEEREAHIKQLQETDIDKLREATLHVLEKHNRVLTMPKDGNVETWSPWLRASVWCNLYG